MEIPIDTIRPSPYSYPEQEQPPSIDEIIVPFIGKTPPTIVCPNFIELRWAFGCDFDCAYCYLQGTGRGNKKFRNRPIDKVIRAIEKAFNYEYYIKYPSIFNSGELTDSLMSIPLIKQIADKFEEQNTHKLLLLTKASNVKFLIEKPRKQTIVSFSINAPRVWKLWEHKTAPPEERIEAARKVSENGYETRIRIDPMVPIKGWEKDYCDLIDQIFGAFKPNRITLGSLRGLYKTIQYCKPEHRFWIRFLSEKETGWGKKIGFALRLSLYSVIINHLKEKHNFSDVALCKETPTVWEKLGMNPSTYPGWERCKCNCTW